MPARSAQDKSHATKPVKREVASLETPRLNLGCGTLIVIFAAVALAGKLVPHTGRGEASRGKLASVAEQSPPPTRPADAPTRKPGPSPALPPAQAKPERGAEHSSGPELDQMLETIASGLQYLITVAGHASSPVGRPSVSSSKVALMQSPQPDPDLEAEAAPDPASSRQSPKHDHRSLPRQGKPPSAQGLGKERQLLTETPSSAQVPDQRTAPGGEVPHPEADIPLGAVVFNSPWNHSVEQVERYLKRHTHDPSSLEIIDWGRVQVAQEGFQVRCSFRSKNVLGKVATQSRNFVLSPDGNVVDIRD
jgi:hypothetical protein